jgi:hypothetical protein
MHSGRATMNTTSEASRSAGQVRSCRIGLSSSSRRRVVRG